jgi:hypothetical protein
MVTVVVVMLVLLLLLFLLLLSQDNFNFKHQGSNAPSSPSLIIALTAVFTHRPAYICSSKYQWPENL